jgi:hypothetical protein
MDELTAILRTNGREFPFMLCSRELELGPAGPVQYFWMDWRTLRNSKCQNYRSCIDFWEACGEDAGLMKYFEGQDQAIQSQSYANVQSLALAELYGLVSKSKGMQDIFADAIPAAVDMKMLTGVKDIPESELQGTGSNGGALSIEALNKDVLRVLSQPLPTGPENDLLSTWFNTWINGACEAYRHGGRKVLRKYLEEIILPWFQRYRQMGNSPRLKMFINLVAFNAKHDFYTAYANVWSSLIPWLRKNQGIDDRCRNLLNRWHYQLRGDPHDDALLGIPLAMHPVSTIIMKCPIHRRHIGEYLERISNEAGVAPTVADYEAYRALLISIRLAAHKYVFVRDAAKERPRSNQKAKTRHGIEIARDDADVSEATLFDRFAAEEGLTCRGCGKAGMLRFQEIAEVDSRQARASVRYRCTECGMSQHEAISLAELEKLLRR